MDDAIRRSILAANENDARQSAIDLAAQGTALAIGQIPVFEFTELNGNITVAELTEQTIELRITGAGSVRAYTVKLPTEWVRTVLAKLDEQTAQANGKPTDDAAAEAVEAREPDAELEPDVDDLADPAPLEDPEAPA